MNVLIFADTDYFSTLLSDVRVKVLNKLLESWVKSNFETNNNKIYYHLIAQIPVSKIITRTGSNILFKWSDNENINKKKTWILNGSELNQIDFKYFDLNI